MTLASRRKEIGLTSIEAAKKLGISQAYLSLLETGKRKIGSKMIKKIAEVYSVSESSIHKAVKESNVHAKVSYNWINQIKIDNEPLRKAFLNELKYLPLKNEDDSQELELRLVDFVYKNIVHSIKNEFNQDKKLLEYFIE